MKCWLRLPQVAWTDHDYSINGKLKCGRYLGDAHRVAILNRGPGYPALAFLANTGTGMVVYDISDPTEPVFVWQWDNDTRFCSTETGDFSWFGSGSGNIAEGYTSSSAPGFVFGIGINYNTGGDIHVFLGNGTDGLRALDLSLFLNPFSDNGGNTERNFRQFSEYHNFRLFDNRTMEPDPQIAWDVRTIDTGGDLFVFVSWLDRIGTDEAISGSVSLSVHCDGDITPPRRSSSSQVSVGMDLTPVSIGVATPNPATSEVLLHLSGTGGESELSIFDLYGRLVLSETVGTPGSGTLFRWGLENTTGQPVPNGLYYFRLTDSLGNSVTSRSTVLR